MKKTYSIVFIVVAVLLGGCQKAATENYAPCVLEFGQMEAEQLKSEPGNYNRTVDLGTGDFVESEKGYYAVVDGLLYYADKTNLSNWVAVCPDPECSHSITEQCAARPLNGMTMENGRIYYMAEIGSYRHLYHGSQNDFGFMYCSMAGNGTDMRMEYVSEESLLSNNSVGAHFYVLPGGYIASKETLNADGSITAGVWSMENGTELLLWEHKYEENEPHAISVFSAKFFFQFYGDRVFCSNIVDGSLNNWIFWIEDGKLKQAEISKIPYALRYISDGILRSFVPNDGYYDYDLETGETVRLADAQLENSGVFILQPNCIFESTMIYSKDAEVEEKANQMEEHAMRFFDGQQWHDVELPAEITELGKTHNLGVRGLQSDCVIFSVAVDPEAPTLYRMMLDQKDYKLEEIGTLHIVTTE